MSHQKITRVLVIEPCYKNFGGYFRAINLSRSLSRHKIHVDLISPSISKFNLKITITNENRYLRLIELPRVNLSLYFNLRILRGLISTFIGLIGHYDIIQASVPTQPETSVPVPASVGSSVKRPIYQAVGLVGDPVVKAHCKTRVSNSLEKLISVTPYFHAEASATIACGVRCEISRIDPRLIECSPNLRAGVVTEIRGAVNERAVEIHIRVLRQQPVGRCNVCQGRDAPKID